MPTGTVALGANIGGNAIQTTLTRTGGGIVYHEIAMAAGLPGSVAWGGASAVITLGNGHGLTTANKVALFWSGGKRRLNLTISAADATTITVTNATGTGDALPTTSTEPNGVVGKENDAPDVNFDGDNAVLFVAACDQRAAANFLDAGTASLKIFDIQTAGDMTQWASNTGVTNPLTGNAVADVKAYNGGTVAATFKIGAIMNT